MGEGGGGTTTAKGSQQRLPPLVWLSIMAAERLCVPAAGFHSVHARPGVAAVPLCPSAAVPASALPCPLRLLRVRICCVVEPATHGVHCLCAAADCCCQQVGHVEVALAAGGLADAHSLVSHLGGEGGGEVMRPVSV